MCQQVTLACSAGVHGAKDEDLVAELPAALVAAHAAGSVAELALHPHPQQESSRDF